MSEVNPKNLNGQLRKSRTKTFGALTDPLGMEMRDPERRLMYYHYIPVVPYYEGGDVTLTLFNRLRRLSPTHGACIGSIADYVFGGGFEIGYRQEPGFAVVDDREVSEAERVNVMEFLSETFASGELMKLAKRLYYNWKTYGNAYCELVLTTVAGTPFAKAYPVDVDRVRYMITLPETPRVLFVSPLWDLVYLHQHFPRDVMAWPSFSQARGENRSIIHWANMTEGREWYGEPDSIESLRYQYMEAQIAQYGSENYDMDFIPRVFFETEGDDEDEAGFNAALRNTFTNEGTQKGRIMHRTRPFDSKQAYIHEFKPNTDHVYHDGMAQLAEAQIIKSHNWHKQLLGSPEKGRLGSATEFKEVYLVKYYTVIKPMQDTVCGWLNEIIWAIADHMGREDIKEYSLSLANLFTDMLEDQKEAVEESPEPVTETQPVSNRRGTNQPLGVIGNMPASWRWSNS